MRPNLLILLTDDHGQWAAGCYGAPIDTPNMDWLARTGARVDNAFTPTPVCSPARACFHTGRFPSQVGLHDYLDSNNPRIEERNWLADELTFYELLDRAGYHVGHFGKWHCGDRRHPKPGTHRWFSFSAGQGAHRGRFAYSDQGRLVELEGCKSRVITDYALDWLCGDHAGRPWAAYVGLIATHSPHAGFPERLVARYRDLAPQHIPPQPPPADAYKTFPPEDWPELQAQYFASVTQIDEQLGRLLDALDDRGELDNTLIVYTSDHGCHAGQLGYWEKGNITRPLNMYERSIRVPMLLRFPGAIQPGQQRPERFDHCDLFATVLDLADASPTPAEREARNYPGRSFAPRLAGRRQPDWPDAQFGEYGPVRMIRTPTHKLLRRHGHGADQLFDLRADPDERQNVIDAPAQAEVVARLDARLETFFARHSEPRHSGLRVRERVGQFNNDEPWDPRFENWTQRHVLNSGLR